MHRELVEERPWLTEAEFLRALSLLHAAAGARGDAARDLCRLEAARRARRAGRGAAVRRARARSLILALALAYASLIDLGWVQALFLGVKAAVVAVVVEAILRVARRALRRRRPLAAGRRGLRRALRLRGAVPARGPGGRPLGRSSPAPARRRAAVAGGAGRRARLAVTLAAGLALWWAPGRARRAARRRPARRGGAVPVAARRRHLRRRLRGAELHGAGGGAGHGLGHDRPAHGFARPRRDDAGPADPRHGLRGDARRASTGAGRAWASSPG